jgi:sulfate adenylyltransferase
VSARALGELELLATGAFAPLSRFMNRADYLSVVETMRLADGTLFPIPITLNVASVDGLGRRIAVRSPSNHLLAILDIEEIFEQEGSREDRFCLSGPLQVLDVPRHYDFPELRHTPARARELLEAMKCSAVIAYSPRDVMRQWDEELTKRAAGDVRGGLLIQITAGESTMEDFTRVQACRALVDNYYDGSKTLLSLLPLATRTGGAREAVLHAIVHRNYGATHMLVEREYAGQVSEAGVIPIPFEPGSGDGEVRPEVAAILAQAYPAKAKQGVCIWFTGLPSAGKSTIAEILAVKLMEHGRRITMLDGDVVRTHLSKGLGFSREDRDVNIRRLGYVSGEIVRHNGTAIVAAVSPFDSTRKQAREMVGAGRFVLVYVATSADVCEGRDVKGFYRKARAGELKHFTGVDDPYEAPADPEIRLETVDGSPEQNANKVFDWLRERGFVE